MFLTLKRVSSNRLIRRVLNTKRPFVQRIYTIRCDDENIRNSIQSVFVLSGRVYRTSGKEKNINKRIKNVIPEVLFGYICILSNLRQEVPCLYSKREPSGFWGIWVNMYLRLIFTCKHLNAF